MASGKVVEETRACEGKGGREEWGRLRLLGIGLEAAPPEGGHGALGRECRSTRQRTGDHETAGPEQEQRQGQKRQKKQEQEH